MLRGAPRLRRCTTTTTTGHQHHKASRHPISSAAGISSSRSGDNQGLRTLKHCISTAGCRFGSTLQGLMPPTTRGAPARCAVTDAPAPPASSAPLAGMIPLVLRHGAVAVADADVCSHPAVGPVLDALPPCVFDTSDDACGAHGAVVLGVRSAAGATPQFDVTVGQLRVSRMLACARNKLWWMTPEWRTSTRELPPETQFMLAEVKGCEGAAYVLLLPLIDGDFRATLRA
ncbi:hypothetical protein FOA52_014418 [Chlamydomonas sp. UWO 241]|nr:hypothetical protein FOA52_014418 [Chlamydomonas sp. UWO 241]